MTKKTCVDMFKNRLKRKKSMGVLYRDVIEEKIMIKTPTIIAIMMIEYVYANIYIYAYIYI